MFDATDLEMARREHLYEMGEDSDADRRYFAFAHAAEAAIIKRGFAVPGIGLDEDEDECGFSLDGCSDAFDAGLSVDAYVETVARKRAGMGL